MKKIILSLVLTIMAIIVSHAQVKEVMIAQPTHVVGKRINANGEVTMTLESNFTYYEDGKPHTFEIPDYNLSTTYSFNDDYLNNESTWHDQGHPIIHEQIVYTYEDDKIKTTQHYWSNVNPSQLWVYTYGDDGRLSRVDYKDDLESDSHTHIIYEYENDGKTKIENHWTSWPMEGMLLRQKNVYQYDDEYNLHTRKIEKFSIEGSLLNSTLDTYTYTASGKLETQITQFLADSVWVNNHIMHYVYDPYEKVLEQQDGSWSTETQDWDINHKVVFGYSDDGTNIIVSFYKKSGEEWVWDVFNNQTILFGSALKNQQRTLRFYKEEVYNGNGNINQFEITLTNTPEPVYMDTEEKERLACTLYPNPATGLVTITGKDLKQAQIINALGQCVATVKGEGEQLLVDISDLPAGVYFVNITDGEGRKCVKKVVKE